jgi:hypothetical protein
LRLPLLPLCCAATIAVVAIAHRDPSPFARQAELSAAPVARLGDDALHWISGPDEVALEPHACFDASGRLWVVWIRYADGVALRGPYLEVAWIETDELRGRARVPLELVAPAHPRLAAHGDGVCCVVEGEALSSGSAAQPAEARSIWALDLSLDSSLGDAALRTSPAARLSGTQSRALDPDVAALVDGSLACVWRTPNGASHDLCLSTRRGDEWSEPLLRATPDDEWHPRLAADAREGAHLVWDAWDGASFAAWSSRIREGRFGSAHALARGPGYAAYVEVAASGEGGAWAVWEEARSFGEFGPLRAARTLALARLGDDAPQRAEWRFERAKQLQPSFPRIACVDKQVVVSARVLDLELRQAARDKPRGEAAFYANWNTRCVGVGAAAPSLDLPVAGGVEATEVLLADPRGGLVCVAATDARTADMLTKAPFLEATEGRWRLGWCRVDTPRIAAPADAPAPVLRSIEPAASRPADVSAGLDAAPARARRVASERAVLHGDLHRHTHQSRCSAVTDGTTEDAYRYARGPGALDFVALTDHYQHQRPWSWWLARRDALRYDDPGRLAVFAGLERVIEGRGHYNEIFLDARAAAWDPERWKVLGPGLEGAPGERSFLIPHMLSLSRNYVRWDKLDPALVRLAEVYQGARGSYEGAGAPLEAPRGLQAKSSLVSALAMGVDVGLIGSSDHNATRGGLAGVRAARLERESIYAALRSRETFACVGACAVDLRIGGLRMGQSGTAEPGAEIEVRADSSAPVASLELLRDGALLQRWSGDGVDRELYVVTLRASYGPPLQVETIGGTIARARTRAVGDDEYEIEVRDDGRVVEARLLGTGLQVGELLVEVVWSAPQVERKLVIRKRSTEAEFAVASLDLGSSRRISIESQSEFDVYVWRIGAPLAEHDVLRRCALPGPGVYRARIAFCDGNLGWTSPVRVLEH